MFNLKSLIGSVRGRPSQDSAVEGAEFPRKLRAFDRLVIAPYDDKAIIAYLKAKWLEDLTPSQIRIFLVLLDWVEEEGARGPTASWIAVHLGMTPNAVRSCLSVLVRKGYVMRRAPGDGEALTKAIMWSIDPNHDCSDPDMLYYEFALL